MEKILVSACLLGRNCKYSGGSNYSRQVEAFIEGLGSGYEAVLVCPEEMGGLTTPRSPAEIRGKLVLTKEGEDVTEAFEKGARMCAALGKELGCRYAILKERSPSCGSGQIYDGTFSAILKEGMGLTARQLAEAGIQVFGETKLEGLEKDLVEKKNK